MAREVTIEFHNGTVKLSVNGVHGKACTDLTAKLEEELGSVQKREFTKEYKEGQEKTSTTVNQ